MIRNMLINDPQKLEREVQRIASALWGSNPGEALPEIVAGRERDCIFHGEEVSHYIECTMQRALAKVESDAKKMVRYRDTELHKGNIVKLWYVTALDPTADQVAAARRNGIKILSLYNFRLHLFEADAYIRSRKNYRWGSATDPKNESTNIEGVVYQRTVLHSDGPEKWDISGVSRLLLDGRTVTLLGDYGMGKSISIREVFKELVSSYVKGLSDGRVPVAINLRDHWGQTDPTEVLIRHSTRIGYDKSAQLVRAYHAGELILLLDGFDEIVGIPVANRRELKRLRSEALTVVRHFVADSRGKSGVLLAGRQNFFDSASERNSALGTTAGNVTLELQELSTEEAEQMLARYQLRRRVPSWLPRRPLFLAYLASQGLLDDLVDSGSTTASQSWDRLIDAICLREKRINEGLDADSIRGILETLANGTRQTSSGRGPIYSEDIIRAYRKTTGYEEPDEHYRPLLMRLPGLTSRNNEDGSREFIDDSMLNALRAPLLASFSAQPYAEPGAKDWKHGISSLGLEMACDRISSAGLTASRVMNAGREAIDRWRSSTLGADLLRAAMRLTPEGEILKCQTRIENARIEDLDFAESPCSDLELAGCEIGVLGLPNLQPHNLVLRDCLIEEVLGITREQQLPSWITASEVGSFDPAPTNASILTDDTLAIAHRVLLTIFRKLFVQPGSGRLEGALSRGLPDNYRPFVAPILDLLRSHGFATLQTARQQRIWFPERSRSGEVLNILNAYYVSSDPLVAEVRKL
jgi:hypothetical protein